MTLIDTTVSYYFQLFNFDENHAIYLMNKKTHVQLSSKFWLKNAQSIIISLN